MRIQPECIPCILNMTVSSLRLLALDEPRIREILSEILRFPAVMEMTSDPTSPELIEQVMTVISETLGDPDPFRAEKKRQNDLLLKAYPRLKDRIQNSGNPFRDAVQLAILGNAVDFMMAQSPGDVEAFLVEKLKTPLLEERTGELRNRLSRTRLLLYFADNCGEIVLDKLLIETIRNEFNPKIILVVRRNPSLNDATLAEA
ncbi:MAG: ARMT1-like domain-containing protein, partial [Thermodesulfobacteriota bacterium]